MNEVAIRLVETPPNAWIDSWLNSLTDKTAKAYAVDIGQFFEFVGHEDVTAISRSDCHDFKGFLMERYSKPATVNRKLCTMRCLLLEAVRYGIISSSPAEGIRGAERQDHYSSTKAPSEEEVRAMLAGIEQDSLIGLRDRAMLSVAAQMGLRRDEIAVLDTTSIVKDQGVVVLEILGKGNKLRRNKIPASTMDAIAKWLAVAKIHAGPLFQPIVGGKASGKRLSDSAIYQIIMKRLAKASIEGCSPHSLRHFNITLLLSRKVDPYAVQRWAGHADFRTTQGYDRAQKNVNESPADALEEGWNGV